MVITSDPLLRTIQKSLLVQKAILLKKYNLYLGVEKNQMKTEIEEELGKIEVLLVGTEMSLERNVDTVRTIKFDKK